MTWADDLGLRVRAARLARGMTQQAAARGADIARDTWRKIEAGGSVQDTKRAIVLAFLELDDQGLPLTAPDPAAQPAVAPRLDEATLDELLDEIAVRRRPGRAASLPDLDEGRASRLRRLRADASPQDRAAYDDTSDDPSDDTDAD